MSERIQKGSSSLWFSSPYARTRPTRGSARAWSSSEIRQLRELADAGLPTHVIAARLERTVSAVKNKAGFHGISVRSAKEIAEVE
jgi:hypothetical protein